MSHILLIDLDRARDAGFTVNCGRDQIEAAANDAANPVPEPSREDAQKQRDKEEFERATTPFPGG